MFELTLKIYPVDKFYWVHTDLQIVVGVIETLTPIFVNNARICSREGLWSLLVQQKPDCGCL